MLNRSRNYGDKRTYERPFSDVTVWVSAAILLFFFLVGFSFNLITVLVIVKNKSLRSVFGYLIFSLCISDLMSAMISPLFWYHRTYGFDDWAIPDFFCKLYWGGDIMTSFATAMHIVACSVYRYVAIKWPFLPQRISSKGVLMLISSIWIVSFCCGFVPFVIWFGARVRDRYSEAEEARWPFCTINMEWYDQYTLFQKIGYPLFLYIPLIIVVMLSAVTAIQVYSSSGNCNTKKKRKEKQAVLQLLLIVISFVIGYLPFTAYEFWSTQPHESTRHNMLKDYYFGLIEYFFIRLSECLNPIFYNLGSTKMRQCTIKFLQNIRGTRTRVMSISTNNDSPPPAITQV